MRGAYYNEIEPFAAQWLRNLIAAGHIAPGDVDERSIVDVRPDDLRGYAQCHFFAGIGVWSHALRTAGWADDRPVWTGSCPCQPFSVAGRGRGVTDERHLWPAWFALVKECQPLALFGEQVSSKDALTWIDLVHVDLEGEGYAVGALDTCAAGIGAPHLRQRLYWVAESGVERREGIGLYLQPRGSRSASTQTARRAAPSSEALGLTSSSRTRRYSRSVPGAQTAGDRARGQAGGVGDSSVSSGPTGVALGDTCSARPQVGPQQDDGPGTLWIEGPAAAEAGIVGGFWGDADLVWCTDGRYRPVGPTLFPLAHGVASRVGQLRAAGNAIVAPLATEFVRAYLDTLSS